MRTPTRAGCECAGRESGSRPEIIAARKVEDTSLDVGIRAGRSVERGSRCYPDTICSLSWLKAKRAKKGAAPSGAVRIVGVEPCFSVADVERAVDHYERLGFTSSYHDKNYAFAHRDDLTIHLARPDEPTADRVGALYLHVNDADQLADDWRKAGMQVVGPEDYDYGKREGSHVDPDGNLIRFGSPLRRPTSN